MLHGMDAGISLKRRERAVSELPGYSWPPGSSDPNLLSCSFQTKVTPTNKYFACEADHVALLLLLLLLLSVLGRARSDATSSTLAAGETSDSPVQDSRVTVRTGRSRRNGVCSKTYWNITQHRRQLSQSANQESGAAARLGDRREGVCEASEGACNQFRIEARVLERRL